MLRLADLSRAQDRQEAPDSPTSTGEAVLQYLEGSRAELPPSLRSRLSPREKAALRRSGEEELKASHVARSRSIGGGSKTAPAQSFAINPNPTPSLNFGRVFEIRRAGDINGDGIGDYLYNADVRVGSFLLVGDVARDERTSALEDRTGKTSVFFGGPPMEGEDQFFYRSLRPVGDLNGDGFADAIALDPEGGTVRIFIGSESGYQDSGVTRSLDLTLYASTDSFSEFVLASNTEPLPVEMAGLEATVDQEEVQLTWRTASETGNARFEVQRRLGGEDEEKEAWTQIGQVGGSGTTTETQSYRFTDRSLPYEAERLEYRLRQVDTDGSTSYSDPVTVERGVDEMELLGTYPNPARGRATVRYALPDRQEVSLRLYDVLGRRVRTVVQARQNGKAATSGRSTRHPCRAARTSCGSKLGDRPGPRSSRSFSRGFVGRCSIQDRSTWENAVPGKGRVGTRPRLDACSTALLLGWERFTVLGAILAGRLPEKSKR